MFCWCQQRDVLAEMDVRRVTFLVLHKCEFPKYFTYRANCQVSAGCVLSLLKHFTAASDKPKFHLSRHDAIKPMHFGAGKSRDLSPS